MADGLTIRHIEQGQRGDALHQQLRLAFSDIAKPDYGDAVTIRPDEVPAFWACGVTPQSIILQSRPDFVITHAPGCMLVTDRHISEFAIR